MVKMINLKYILSQEKFKQIRYKCSKNDRIRKPWQQTVIINFENNLKRMLKLESQNWWERGYLYSLKVAPPPNTYYLQINLYKILN